MAFDYRKASSRPRGGVSNGGGGGSSFAPNMPGGLTTIVDRQWNPTDTSIPGGVLPPATLTGTDQYGMAWASNDTGSLTAAQTKPLIDTPANLTSTIGVTIPALPDANPTAMAIRYISGFPAGFRPFTVFKSPTGGLVQKLYLACWVLMPSNCNSNGNNFKWVGFQQSGPSNHIAMLSSFSNLSDGRASWMVVQGGGTSGYYGGFNPSSGNNSGALTSLTYPPQGSGAGWWQSFTNQWVCCEWYMQTESNPGVSSDGVFKGWHNGVLINSWANIRYNAASGDSNGFNNVAFIPYYGGGGSAAPADEYLCMGRFFASGA